MKNFDNIFNREKRNDARESDFKKKKYAEKSFGDRGSRDRRDRPEMFEATCSACGRRCEVPFRPTGDKPVYCSDCFSKQGGGNTKRPERRDFGRSRFQEKRMFDAVCDKCGRRFELPFRPTGDKPVYCNNCFDKGGSRDSVVSSPNQYKDQFEALNAKLDMLIKILTPSVKKEEEENPKKSTVKKIVKKEEKKEVISKTMAKGNNSRKKEVKKPKKDKKK